MKIQIEIELGQDATVAMGLLVRGVLRVADRLRGGEPVSGEKGTISDGAGGSCGRWMFRDS